MAIALAAKETGMRKMVQPDLRVVYSLEELNRSYQEYDREYNSFTSNWDWFVSSCPEETFAGDAVISRIHQN